MKVLVVHYGGCTFEASICLFQGANWFVNKSVTLPFEAGNKIKEMLVQHIFEDLKNNHKGAVFNEEIESDIRHELSKSCDRAIYALSQKEQTHIKMNVKMIYEVDKLLKRSDLERLTAQMANHINEQLDELLSQARLRKHQISKVIIEGGSAQAHWVIQLLERFVEDPGKILTTKHSAAELAALGAMTAAQEYKENRDSASQYSGSSGSHIASFKLNRPPD